MIELKNLSKIYFDKPAVDDISLTIPQGSIFGFLGANGAGKTTTMKMLVGISTPDKGSIKIDGSNPSEDSVKQKIAFMPESPYFYDHLTGLEFLTFCSELFKLRKSKKELEEILKGVGIFDARNNMVSTYSKGMKQRLGFAQATVNNPEYIFLDEPLDGLDPVGRREIKKIILSLKKEKRTIFFNSHILFDVEEICDMIGILHGGKLLYSGDVKTFCDGKSLEERFVELVEKQK